MFELRVCSLLGIIMSNEFLHMPLSHQAQFPNKRGVVIIARSICVMKKPSL